MAIAAMRHRALILFIVAAAGVLGAIAWKYFERQGSQGGVRQTAVPVVLAPARQSEFVERIDGIGTASANESVALTAKVTDTVSRVHFEDGDFVEKGAILLEMTNAQESAMLAEAQATLNQARKEYERVTDLVRQGNAPTSRLDTALAARETARARVDAIAAQLNDRLIRAPFSGVLGFRRVSEGTLLTSSTEIATLDDIGVIKLDFAVPEIHLALLRPGLEIAATSSAYAGQSFSGSVKTVNSRVDPVTRAVMVRAEVANPDRLLRPGMLLNVALIERREMATAVPEDALVPIRDQQFVFLIDASGAAIQKEVRIGRRKPGLVEILEGLRPGDMVVTQGTLQLREGAAVQVVRRETSEAAAEGQAGAPIAIERKPG